MKAIFLFAQFEVYSATGNNMCWAVSIIIALLMFSSMLTAVEQILMLKGSKRINYPPVL